FNATSSIISNNIIQNNTINSAAGFNSFLIHANNSSSNVDINNNTMTNNYKTVSSSFGLYGIYNISGTATGTCSIHDNLIDGLSVPSGSNTFCVGIRLTSAVAQLKSINNNTVKNISGGVGTSVLTCGISADLMPAGSTVNNNIVSNITGPVTGVGINCASTAFATTSSSISFTTSGNTISTVSGGTSLAIGLTACTSASGTDVTCSDNSVDNIYSSSTGTAIMGIRMGGGTAGSNYIICNNSISNIKHSGFGGATISGIAASATAPLTIYNNNIYEINGTTSSDQAYGINMNGGTGDATVYNNFIQRIYCPGSISSAGVIGIGCQQTNTFKIYYNTIALGQNSMLGGGTNGGCAGVYFSAASTLDLRNNIIYVNASYPGTGVAACVRRLTVGVAYTPSANFATTSNNNYYYINPGTWNYIYEEGNAGGVAGTLTNGYAWSGATTSVTYNLNNDPCFNEMGVDNTSYKFFMSPRESNSYYDVQPFAGGVTLPDNLKLTPGATTYAESNASVIAGITTDYEGDPRSGSTPDIGADEGPFVIQPPACYLLPIELIEFTGWFNGVENELHWKTGTEINSNYFEIQKSPDGINFSPIGIVDAAGNSTSELNYLFYDDDPIIGINYYKLKMVDQDGSFEFTNTIAIRVDGDGVPAFIVYPNPVIDMLNISMSSSENTDIVARVTDVLGRNIGAWPYALQNGQNTFSIDVSLFAPATYFIIIIDISTGEQHVIKFVKEN
ncbi:MAG: T9SS type A sorting domain-containing protein, partial [Chitinophagales bacterium]